MKSSYLVSILLAVAVVLLSVKILFFSMNTTSNSAAVPAQPQPVAVDTASVVLNNIATRTSIRNYTSEPVSEEHIMAMLRAAMAAPTARNLQPWHFVVVDDRATIDSFTSVARGMQMAPKAPLAIVVCGEVDNSVAPEEGRDYWVQDASAATENLLLSANALGLGAVWCGVYPIPERMKRVVEMISLPENIVPLNAIFIGHPAEDPLPKDKWKPGKIHRNKW